MQIFFPLWEGPRPQLPIEGPWRHGSLKGFLKNVDAGKEETGKLVACLLPGMKNPVIDNK